MPLFLLLGLPVSFFSEGVPEAYSSTDVPPKLENCDSQLVPSSWPTLEEAQALLTYQGVKVKRVGVFQNSNTLLEGLIVESDSPMGHPFNVYAHELKARNGTSIIYYRPTDDTFGAGFVAPPLINLGLKAIQMPRVFLLKFDPEEFFFIHETEHAERHFLRSDPKRASILSVDLHGNLGGVAYQGHLNFEEIGTFARQVKRQSAKLIASLNDAQIISGIHRDLNIQDDIRTKVNAAIADVSSFLEQADWPERLASVGLEDYGTVETVIPFEGGFRVHFYVNQPRVVESYKSGRSLKDQVSPEDRPLIEAQLKDQIAQIKKITQIAESDLESVIIAFTAFFQNRTRENAEKLLADATLMADHITELEMNSR